MSERVKFKEERKDRDMLWMGKPLREYSKEELIEIVYHLAKQARHQQEQHMRDLEVLVG